MDARCRQGFLEHRCSLLAHLRASAHNYARPECRGNCPRDWLCLCWPIDEARMRGNCPREWLCLCRPIDESQLSAGRRFSHVTQSTCIWGENKTARFATRSVTFFYLFQYTSVCVHVSTSDGCVIVFFLFFTHRATLQDPCVFLRLPVFVCMSLPLIVCIQCAPFSPSSSVLCPPLHQVCSILPSSSLLRPPLRQVPPAPFILVLLILKVPSMRSL